MSEEVAVKNKIWDLRFETRRLFQEIAKELAERTKNLAVVGLEEGEFYYSGTASLLEIPEFYDINLTKRLLLALEEMDYWQKIFEKIANNPLGVLLAGDLEDELFEPCGFVGSPFETKDKKGVVGVFGSNRIDYPYVISLTRYISRLLSEIGG